MKGVEISNFDQHFGSDLSRHRNLSRILRAPAGGRIKKTYGLDKQNKRNKNRSRYITSIIMNFFLIFGQQFLGKFQFLTNISIFGQTFVFDQNFDFDQNSIID